jgi:hypothetical protein
VISRIDATSEEAVIERAVDNLICLISLPLCVTPATRIPIISITTDNSTSENALFFFIKILS